MISRTEHLSGNAPSLSSEADEQLILEVELAIEAIRTGKIEGEYFEF